MTNRKYCACTVSVRDGKTYWNEPKSTLGQLIGHLNKYVKRNCHVIIYTVTGDKDLKFHSHISNFNKKYKDYRYRITYASSERRV